MPGLPPGPRSRIPGRVAAVFARDRLGFLEEMTARYGDVVYFRVAGYPLAILNHPDYVRDVLVTRQRMFHKGIGLVRASLLLGKGLLTSEDMFHLRQRRLMQPAFHRDRVEGYASTMVDASRQRAATWSAGSVLDVQEEMAQISIAIAGRTLFGSHIESEAEEIRDALTDTLSSFDYVLMPYGDLLARLPIPPAIRFRRARARLDAIVYRLIAERRAAGTDGGDLLSMLIQARDEEGDGEGMTDLQVRDEAVTILLAGFETVSNALSWTSYLLSQHPDVEARLHAEIERGDVMTLPYTRAVLAESMRLYPPAFLLGRTPLTPYDVPGTDYVIPAGGTVFLCQHLLHRDPRFWTEPLRFHPDRWLGASPEPAQRFAYFPFGAGTRICIGEHFAWMEATIVLATIARRWRFTLVPGQRIEPQPIITLRSRYGMKMTLHERHPAWTPPIPLSSGV